MIFFSVTRRSYVQAFIAPNHNRNRAFVALSSTTSPAEYSSTTTTGGPVPYPFAEVEPKWQKYWEENQTFKTPTRDRTKPKKYVLDMFPYPSGAGLHVGHPEGYTGRFQKYLTSIDDLRVFLCSRCSSFAYLAFIASDVMARYWRMTGHDVLHPIGWDSFGLPAEQFAVQTGAQPADTTKKNIANFKRQLKMLGFSYDWEKELATTDVNYVKWTQWIFLQLFKKGLAAQSEVSVNWCPALGTVLANEEIINGKSERGDHPVVRLPLRQWVLKITQYADRLQAGLDGLDWPSGTMTAQQQWIGKSTGCQIVFDVEGSDDEVRSVYYTLNRLSIDQVLSSNVNFSEYHCFHHTSRHVVGSNVRNFGARASVSRFHFESGTEGRG